MGQGLHYEKEVAELYEALIRADCRDEIDIDCDNCIFSVGNGDNVYCKQSELVEIIRQINNAHPPVKIEKIVFVAEKTELQTVIDKYED